MTMPLTNANPHGDRGFARATAGAGAHDEPTVTELVRNGNPVCKRSERVTQAPKTTIAWSHANLPPDRSASGRR